VNTARRDEQTGRVFAKRKTNFYQRNATPIRFEPTQELFFFATTDEWTNRAERATAQSLLSTIQVFNIPKSFQWLFFIPEILSAFGKFENCYLQMAEKCFKVLCKQLK